MDAQLDGTLFGDQHSCFGCSPNHPTGLKLQFERAEDGGVRTYFTPTERHEGAPGIMHGGLVMTVADELGAWALIAELERFGFTTHAACRYKRPARIGEKIEGLATIKKAGRRTVDTEVRLQQGGEEIFSAELKFMILEIAQAEKLLGRPLPEEWRRFGRA